MSIKNDNFDWFKKNEELLYILTWHRTGLNIYCIKAQNWMFHVSRRRVGYLLRQVTVWLSKHRIDFFSTHRTDKTPLDWIFCPDTRLKIATRIQIEYCDKTPKIATRRLWNEDMRKLLNLQLGCTTIHRLLFLLPLLFCFAHARGAELCACMFSEGCDQYTGEGVRVSVWTLEVPCLLFHPVIIWLRSAL